MPERRPKASSPVARDRTTPGAERGPPPATRGQSGRHGGPAAVESWLDAASVVEELVSELGLGHVGPWRHAVSQPNVSTDRGAAANRDAPEHGGTCLNDHIVLDDWVARGTLEQVAAVVGGEALGAEGDALVEPDVLTDDASLADHDARAVIDEEARSNARAGVDIDAGRLVSQLGDHSRNERHAQCVQLVRDAMVADGRHAYVREHRLVDAGRGRVTIERRARVAAEQYPDGR